MWSVLSSVVSSEELERDVNLWRAVKRGSCEAFQHLQASRVVVAGAV